MIDEHAPGRFALHDLLREYAVERAESTGTEASRRAATQRMLDHYLHTAFAAGKLCGTEQSWFAPPGSARGVTLGRFDGQRAAADWLETEHLALMAAITLAADLGFELHACQLAVTLTGVLDQSACWEDLAASSAIAVAAARQAGHLEAEAYAQRGLGGAFARLGRYSDAHVHLQRCLEQFTALENTDGQARVHLNLACLLHYMDDSEQALRHAHRARELFELLQQGAGLAGSLNTAGWLEARLGDTEKGLAYCEQGLALAQEIGNRVMAAATWDSLGYVRDLLGQHEAAIRCYEQAAAIYADLGAVWYRAEVLINLGDAHEVAGGRQAARELWQEALEVYERTHHPGTERLRAKLALPQGTETAKCGHVPMPL